MDTVPVVTKLKKMLGNKTLWTTGSNFLIIFLSLTANIIIARTVGVDGRGELSAVFAWNLVIRAFFELGVPQALTFLLAKQELNEAELLSASLILALFQGIIVFLIVLLFGIFLLHSNQPNTFINSLIYSISTPCIQGVTYITALMLGKSKVMLFNCLRIFQAFLLPLSALVLLIDNVSSQTQVNRLIIILTCLQFIGLMVSLIFALRVFRCSFKNFSKNIKLILNKGLKSFWGNMAWMLNGKLDQFLMSFMLPVEQLGIYSVGVAYANLNLPIGGAIANLTFARTAKSSDINKNKAIIYQSLRNGVITLLGVSLILALASQFIIPLVFGSNFKDSIFVSLIIMAGGVLLGLNYILSDGLRGLGFPETPSKAEFLSLGFTIVALLIFLIPFQLVGAAFISVIAYAMVFFILFRSLQKIAKLNIT